MPYVYYTADDGSTHLCHTDMIEHGFGSRIKKAGNNFKENWKMGAGLIGNKANDASVKVTAAAIDKTVDIVCKELSFAITTNERDLIRAAANQIIKDLKDEGSLYRFVKKEISRLRDMRQHTQDLVIGMYKNANKAYNAANNAYNEYEQLSPTAKKQYQTAAKTAYKYATKYGSSASKRLFR